jgi:chemotaxis protein histidine kinase CheA
MNDVLTVAGGWWRDLLDARVVLETTPADPTAWDQVRRAAHAIAGNAALIGLDALAKTARSIERRAVAIGEGSAGIDDVWLLDAERDMLGRLIRASHRGATGPGVVAGKEAVCR